MKDVRDAIADILDHTTLQEVVARSSAATRIFKQVIDYQI
jgi:DNA-binding IscR family transcriptional regulator